MYGCDSHGRGEQTRHTVTAPDLWARRVSSQSLDEDSGA